MSDIAIGGFKRLARHTFVYAFADLTAKGGAFLLVPIITRFIETSGVGTYSLVVSTIVPVLTLVASLGLGSAVTRLWFDLDAESRKRFQLAAFVTVQATALGIALLLTLVGPSLFGRIFKGIDGSLFTFGVWTSFFLASTTVPLAILRAEERPAKFAILSGAQFAAPVTGVAIALAISRDIHTVLWGNVIGASSVLLFSIAFMIPLMARPAKWDLMRHALALGLPIVPHLVAHWALNVSDRIAIQRTLGVDQVALYSVGYQIAQGVSLIATALNNATVPTFYRAAQQNRRETLGRAWAPLLYGIGIFSVGVSIFGTEAIHIAKHSFYSAAAFIPWVALGYWFLAAYYFPVNALFYAKRVRMIPIATVLAAVLNYELNIHMLGHRGLIAAAQNTTIAYGVLFGLVMIAAQRTYKLPYRFGKAFALMVVGSGAYGLSRLVPSGFAGTALKLPIFALYLVVGFLIVARDIRSIRDARGADTPSGRKVVLAAATSSQARTMALVGDALTKEGLEPSYVSLDPILGKTASLGFKDSGVQFREHGSARGQLGIVVRGRRDARALVEGSNAVIIGNDFTPFERLVIDEARAAGCASVLLQDGVISLEGDQAGGGARSGSAIVNIAKRVLTLGGMPFDQRPYGCGGCDAICVYGPSTKATLEKRGVPSDRIFVTGQPRYDALRSGSTPRTHILVTTQPFSRYGLASLEQETSTFVSMINGALSESSSVIVKLHPDTDSSSRQKLMEQFKDRVTFEQAAPIDDLYRGSTALVTLSSTTALEAMLYHVPVVVVDVPGFPTTLPYVESGAVVVARGAEEIAPAIREALAGSASTHAAIDRFLSEHLAPVDGLAAQRVADVVSLHVSSRKTMTIP
ncbi:MAG: oligosaccharide flippase family protein [Actinomycetota bacterium]